jgi:crotonobetainyl-CoA:carnitine CoA-transferase CaiB-like acyl-CoA transferase
MSHLGELTEALGKYFARRTTADWLERLEAARVPAGPVLSVGEMHADPQTRARDMVLAVDHSRVGPVRTLGLPVKFSETAGGIVRGAPVLGQHTREVLRENGYDGAEIEKLIAEGAVIAG